MIWNPKWKQKAFDAIIMSDKYVVCRLMEMSESSGSNSDDDKLL